MNNRGYTLVEMMIVVTLIFSVMIPVYPVVLEQYQYYVLEQEAHKLGTFLEKFRQQAALENKRTVIRFFVSSSPYSYGARDGVTIVERHYLPEGIVLHENLSNNSNVIEFGAFGTVRPHGGTIRLTNKKGETKEVVIHLFSGMIEIR